MDSDKKRKSDPGGRRKIGKTYNQFHNILRLSMFYQIFLSPQVKRWMIITYKHGIYKLPHELPNDLRVRNLGK